MKYVVKINKRVRYIRVYTIVKKLNERQNVISKALTGFFMKILGQGEKKEEGWEGGK
ncbi:MAG: hypothetical protein ACP5K5_00635 [Candidatus Micrarchaeia archaeon]